jgi:hypothetical protein
VPVKVTAWRSQGIEAHSATWIQVQVSWFGFDQRLSGVPAPWQRGEYERISYVAGMTFGCIQDAAKLRSDEFTQPVALEISRTHVRCDRQLSRAAAPIVACSLTLQ